MDCSFRSATGCRRRLEDGCCESEAGNASRSPWRCRWRPKQDAVGLRNTGLHWSSEFSPMGALLTSEQPTHGKTGFAIIPDRCFYLPAFNFERSRRYGVDEGYRKSILRSLAVNSSNANRGKYLDLRFLDRHELRRRGKRAGPTKRNGAGDDSRR